MILENKNLFSILRLNMCLLIGGIKLKFDANRFLIFRFLVAAFYCMRVSVVLRCKTSFYRV